MRKFSQTIKGWAEEIAPTETWVKVYSLLAQEL